MSSIRIDENIRKVLEETDLTRFEKEFVFQLNLTRLRYFNDVLDSEFEKAGLSSPAIRRLRHAVDKYERESRTNRKPERLIEVRLETEGDTPSDPIHHDSPCLIHRDDIKLLDKLGAGSFGVVKRAFWKRPSGQEIECAIKVLRGAPNEVKNDLQNEIVNMQKLSHHNLVRLYGIVFAMDDTTLMVVELCSGGALIDRLRDAQRPIPLVPKLVEYALQIATGMEYLEKMRCVHRDLAARNVLLLKNEETIKICDFGLSRHLEDNSNYYTMDTSTPKRVPFAWCAPESLRYRQFSHKSDVWSFGVTLWELFTDGEEPWLGLHIAEVLRMIEQGKRMEKPPHSNDELAHIMDLCWKKSPEERPNFTELKTMLGKINLNSVTCIHTELAKKNTDLTIMTGDKVYVVDDKISHRWYGQNERTGKFGYFSSANVKSASLSPKILPDPKNKPKIVTNVPIQVTATPSSGHLRLNDTPNLHLGHTPANITHSTSAQKLAGTTFASNIHHSNSAQNLVQKQAPPKSAPPPIPRHSFRAPKAEEPVRKTSEVVPKVSRMDTEDDACCKKSSIIPSKEEDAGFSQVQLRLAMLLSQAEAEKHDAVVRVKPPGGRKIEDRPPETSQSPRNSHESFRTAIATAPLMDTLSRSPDPNWSAYPHLEPDYDQEPTTIARDINRPNATAPEPSPGSSGLLLGFEQHYMTTDDVKDVNYPKLDFHDYSF